MGDAVATLTSIATVVGWIVLGATALFVLTAACLLAWAYFPLRFDWMRPYGATVSTRVGAFPVTYWIGLSSRRSIAKGWFLGQQTYGAVGEEPPRGPRIVTKKATTPIADDGASSASTPGNSGRPQNPIQQGEET